MRQIAAKVLRVVRNVLCVLAALLLLFLLEIGRASCRERVWTWV